MIPMMMVPMIVSHVGMSFIEHASTIGDIAINHAQHAAWISNLQKCTAKPTKLPVCNVIWPVVVDRMMERVTKCT
jgi:hypothetical protein